MMIHSNGKIQTCFLWIIIHILLLCTWSLGLTFWEKYHINVCSSFCLGETTHKIPCEGLARPQDTYTRIYDELFHFLSQGTNLIPPIHVKVRTGCPLLIFFHFFSFFSCLLMFFHFWSIFSFFFIFFSEMCIIFYFTWLYGGEWIIIFNR